VKFPGDMTWELHVLAISAEKWCTACGTELSSSASRDQEGFGYRGFWAAWASATPNLSCSFFRPKVFLQPVLVSSFWFRLVPTELLAEQKKLRRGGKTRESWSVPF